jgi:hypothetical protein
MREKVTNGIFSRCLEINPASGEVAWSYGGNAAQHMYSEIRGSQQALPNGNVLITDSGTGRILEVSREGTLVWEFVNPARWRKDPNLIACTFSATRLSAAELPFLESGRDQTAENTPTQ